MARTLEYSYDDFTIWKLAQVLGRPQEEIDRFYKRANYYKNVFDPSTNFMRGKKKDGSWSTPFVPEKWGGDFTEGCAWHYTWSVFQDPQGMIDLMGGKEEFITKLDAVFTTPPKYDCSYYGFPIHEIVEMTVMDMVQYAHGNQPIQDLHCRQLIRRRCFEVILLGTSNRRSPIKYDQLDSDCGFFVNIRVDINKFC